MIGNIIRRIRTKIFTLLCKGSAKQVGNGVHINHKCKFSRNTIIGNNCHFNGMRISGHGCVIIGDNFHSGENIRILTTYHNFDRGEAIPYDNTSYSKDVVIEDNVWLGKAQSFRHAASFAKMFRLWQLPAVIRQFLSNIEIRNITTG